MILVTGGAGFIGSNFVIQSIQRSDRPIINVDKLGYSGHLENLELVAYDANYHFIQGDILDRPLIANVLKDYQPEAIVHFAAETHVDRSIVDPKPFIESNVVGTYSLLEEAKMYWEKLSGDKKEKFRFLHVSTDEVFGSLSFEEAPFTEDSKYAPNSPYSASKASADHLVRAYHHTYGFPTIISNCSNNFGPYQYPEKLIPLMILHAIEGKPLPIYGDGKNMRDWLYVEDHCSALRLLLEKGAPGSYYNVGGGNEMSNRDIVFSICDILDQLFPHSPHKPHRSLITYVSDRPGHDLRYAIDSSKIRNELGWTPQSDFKSLLYKTIEWYKDHPEWIKKVTKYHHSEWMKTNYSDRLNG